MKLLHRLLLLAFCFGCSLAAEGFDAYLKLDTIDGESTDSNHQKWIDVLSFAHGMTQGSPAQFSPLCLLKRTDSASPLLAQRCAQGTHLAYGTLDLVTADANRLRFYQIGLSNVVVSSFSGSGASGGDRATENLCLRYSYISWSYTEVDPKGAPIGNLSAWWDLPRNIGGTNNEALFRVTATQIDVRSLRLTWPGQAGKTYNILGSSTVNGTYQQVQSVTASVDGVQSVSLAISPGMQFFRVQETP